MKIAKITLMEAYMIETLTNKGVSRQELLQANESSIKQWQQEHENFDFTLLQSLAEDQEVLQSILDEGYQIKFLTYNGLINLLRLKFSKEPGQDYNQLDESVENLKMTEEQQVVLKKMLSPNWSIVSGKEENTISITQTNQL